MRIRPLLDIPFKLVTISTESIRRAQTMSLNAARARPRGSRANAIPSNAVREASVKVQIFENCRNFRGTPCDSKAALLPPVGYGSYIPARCDLRVTWHVGSYGNHSVSE